MSNDNVFAPALLAAMDVYAKSVSESEKSERTKNKAADALHAIGFLSFMAVSPKGDEANEKHDIGGVENTRAELFELAKITCVHGMPAAKRDLILATRAETKNWPKYKKDERQAAQRQIPQYVIRMKQALQKLEGVEPTGSKKTDHEKLVTYINSVYTLLMKESVEIEANHTDVVKATRELAKVAGIKELKADTK